MPACTHSICSYNEALPFMLAVPLFTVHHVHRIFVTDCSKLGTLIHIRNLNLSIGLFDSLNFFCERHNTPGWIQACRTLSSMTSLRYLCVLIMRELFSAKSEYHLRNRSAELVRQLMEPLESIKMAEGGRFDIICHGWRVPYELSDDLPFRVIQKGPPPLTDLANRTQEWREFSPLSYLKLTTMPCRLSYGPYTAPMCGLPNLAPT